MSTRTKTPEQREAAQLVLKIDRRLGRSSDARTIAIASGDDPDASGRGGRGAADR